jgi:uncharacterized damage-inducible protein DinB
MPSLAELLFADFKQEHASTRRVLQRYPDGKGEWRPHAKSRPLAALATHVADVINRGTQVLETDAMEVGRQPIPPLDSASELVTFFDANVERLTAALAATSDDALEQLWSIRHGGRVLIEQPRRLMLRTIMMSHLVHHRAQLGVYYRLLDIPVPGVYGPTADEAV